MPKSKLPDRWENYSNIGDVIEGTRLITFKVPLNEFLCRKYEDDRLWFTPDTLIETTESNGVDLGLIIDLTFTTRYYHFESFTSRGILYEKIFVPGHVIPDDDIIDRFFSVIDQFLEDNADNDKIIGIHCTHGVNRTGYVVCRYMIERLGWKPEDAIEAYGKARGYPIERENYLEDLKERPKKLEEIDGKDNKTENSAVKSKCDKPFSRKFHAISEENQNDNSKRRKHDHQSNQNGYYESDRARNDSYNFRNRTDQYQWPRSQYQYRGFQNSGASYRTRQGDCDQFGSHPYQSYQQGWSNFGHYGGHSGYGNYARQREQPYKNGNFNSYQSGYRNNQSMNDRNYSCDSGNQSNRNRYKWSKNDSSESSSDQAQSSSQKK